MQYTIPPKSEKSLIANCNKIAGKSIGEIAIEYNIEVPKNLKSVKGWIGQFLEYTLGASAKSRPIPDFEYLDIELKTIPVSENLKPLESTYICSINMQKLINQTWENSLIRKKISKILWVPIIVKSKDISERIIASPILWEPSEHDLNIIKRDWLELIELLSTGSIEEIQGKFGEYLQIRPKAANSRSRSKAYNSSGEIYETLPRGFYFRAKFTEKILRVNYL